MPLLMLGVMTIGLKVGSLSRPLSAKPRALIAARVIK